MRRPITAIEQLYRHTAPRYEEAITPVMRPFARNLVRAATLKRTDTVLDIGTGTGVLAREAAGYARMTIGVDLVWPMLHIARTLRPSPPGSRVCFLCSDANSLSGLADSCCDVALASFGLGDCDPGQTLCAIARVLRPRGRLYLQEWGPYDGPTDLRVIVDDTLAAYVTTTAGGLRLLLRQHLAEPRPWDQHLQDADDYAEALVESGFDSVAAREGRPVTVTLQPGVERFLTYTLAWASRLLELQALDERARQQFFRAVTRRLRPLQNPAGVLRWSPLVIRASGVKKF